jgi:tetratricopeptide (TPR) repeat protein
MANPKPALGQSGNVKPAEDQLTARMKGAQALLAAVAAKTHGQPARPAFKAAPASKAERKATKKAIELTTEATKALHERRYKTAETLFDQAIALFPSPPHRLLINRLTAASKAANHAYVAEHYPQIRALATTDEEKATVDHIWIDCLVAAGYPDQALELIAAWRNSDVKIWASIQTVAGIIEEDRGNVDKAMAIQEAILARDPNCDVARWHLSLHQMAAGKLPDAFDNYDVRWKISDFPSERRLFDIPRWQGEALQGKKILVWREQGVGDEIRFAGLLADLVEIGADVTFECTAKLLPLFRPSFPDITVRPVVPAANRTSALYAEFDFETPLGSLPRFLRPSVEALKTKARPFLKRSPEVENNVREAMNARPDQPVIGLCWRSSLRNLHRDKNYLRAEHIAALKLLGKSGFICLQYDQCADEVALMQELGLPVTQFTSIDQMNDLAGAALLAGACDLVISAGTATAELSAGLGVPTLLFGPEHSRTRLGTEDMPWHPATRYMPTNPDEPIELMKAILFNWGSIATWAAEKSISGRKIDWSQSYPRA